MASPAGPVAGPIVGMVGGGQLARMTQPAAIALGVRFAVLTGSADDSAAQVVPATTIGDERDLADLQAFAKQCDLVTFDHENVPPDHLRTLEAAGVVVRPASAALIHAQDKGVMRARLTAAGIPCPRHRIVFDQKDVLRFAAEMDTADASDHADSSGLTSRAVVLKTTRGGYDGKGVWTVPAGQQPPADPFRAGVPVLADEFVEFRRELAALAVRSPSGQAVAYPVVESVQRDGICVEVLAPAPGLPDGLALEAQGIALTVAAELGVVGVLAVEMFETRDGRLLVNELAMRPHNTGHWTIDGAVTSQFENHLRAVLDLPLGTPNAVAPYTVMVNVLGGEVTDVVAAYRHCMARDPGLKIHWYGKTVRPGRKVGHVTVAGEDVDELRQRAWEAAEYLRAGVDE